jgi:ACS family hexuronate transporter-like MFS transporter
MPTHHTESAPTVLDHQPQSPLTRYRWVILALIFFGTTINYVDRQVMNILGPYLCKQFNITDPQWGNIGAAFGLSYAFGQLLAGGLLDRVGVRIGYPLGLFFWSLVSIATAWSIGLGHALGTLLGLSSALHVAVGFGVMRAFLGFTEAPNFPAVAKTLAEWFPKKERAFAMGWVNAGTNIGIFIALLVAEPLTRRFGWQYAFVVTGSLGLLWLLFWLPIYRLPEHHPRVSPAELAYINSDPPESPIKLPWRTLLTYRQAWAFTLAKFITDAMWLFYLVWFAKFLTARYGLDIRTIGLPLIVVYLLADVGSVGGGWISSAMLQRGATVNRARKTALFLCALMVVPIAFAAVPNNMWISVLLLGLANAGHQGFSSNLYTLVSDTFPKRAVASVAGLGGTFGYVGGALFSSFTGYVLKWNHNSYTIPFVIAGSAYLLSFLIIHLLAPKLEPVNLE